MSRKPQIYTDVRRNDVRRLLLEGKTTSHIAAYCNHTYGVSRRTVERDISAIYDEIKKEVSREKQSLIEMHVARYENLYRFYMDTGTEENPNIHFNPEIASKMLEKKERLIGALNKQGETYVENQQVNNYTLNLNDKTLEELFSARDKLNEESE